MNWTCGCGAEAEGSLMLGMDPGLDANGGFIAILCPLGMTGARLLLSASIELQEKQKRYALVTMCLDVGQGYAAVIERV